MANHSFRLFFFFSFPSPTGRSRGSGGREGERGSGETRPVSPLGGADSRGQLHPAFYKLGIPTSDPCQ